jgi:hypothetical protein
MMQRSSALFFRTGVASKFGGVLSSQLFLFTRYCISIYTLETMYRLSLGVGKILCCPVCDLDFIGELKILNT